MYYCISSCIKAKSKQENQVQQNEEDFTFSPQLFSVPLKKFEGSAKALTERSGANHIQRQNKARENHNKMYNIIHISNFHYC